MKKPPILVFGTLLLAIGLMIGCGGGGGGGGTTNPMGPVATGSFASLRGIVSYNGRPVANAVVALYPTAVAEQAGLDRLAAVHGTMRAGAINGAYSTTSDQSGRYAFEQIPVGEYTLVAIMDATHQFAQPGIVLGAITEVNALITPTGTIAGQISAPGAPTLAGGLVYLQGTSFVALTDETGAFTISNVPASTTFSLRATLGGFALTAPLPVVVPPGATHNVGVLTLAPVSQPGTGILAGKTNPAQAGILVLARRLPLPGQTAAVTLTDPAGNFQLHGLASGTYQLEFAAEAYLPLASGPFTVLPGTTLTIENFVLTPRSTTLPTATLNGVATKTLLLAHETTNGGINLMLVNPSGSHMAVTESNGGFSFTVPHGTWRLVALSPWALVNGPNAGLTVINGSATISVPGTTLSGLLTVSLLAPPGPRYQFTGRITKQVRLGDEIDNSGLNLLLTSPNGATFFAVTNGAGDFIFDNLPADTYALSLAGRYELNPTPYTFTITTSNHVNTTLVARPVVPPGAVFTFEGTIAKTPRLADEFDNGGLSLLLRQMPPGNLSFTSITDPSGKFVFSGIPSGTYDFSVQGRYRLNTPTATDTVVLNANVNRSYSAVPLPPKPVAVVFGTVLKTQFVMPGENHSGIVVQLASTTDNFLMEVETDAVGSFSFPAIPIGWYDIRIRSRDYRPAGVLPPIEVVTPNTGYPTVINVNPIALFTGTVEGQLDFTNVPAGKTLEVVLTNSATKARFEVMTDPTGRFRFENIPPTSGNDYVLSLPPDQGYGFGMAIPPFALASKQLVQINGMAAIPLNLTAPGIVSYTIDASYNLQVNGTNLFDNPVRTKASANGIDLPPALTPWPGGQAIFQIRDLAPGTYTLRLTNPDGSQAVASTPLFRNLDGLAPGSLAIDPRPTQVEVKWPPIPFATAYRATITDGLATQTIETSATIVTFGNVRPNITYTVTVRGLRGSITGPVAISSPFPTPPSPTEYSSLVGDIDWTSDPFVDAALVPGQNILIKTSGGTYYLRAVNPSSALVVATMTIGSNDVFAALDSTHVYVTDGANNLLKMYDGDLVGPIGSPLALTSGSTERLLTVEPETRRIALFEHEPGSSTCQVRVLDDSLNVIYATSTLPLNGNSPYNFAILLRNNGRYFILAYNVAIGGPRLEGFDASDGFESRGLRTDFTESIRGLMALTPTTFGVGTQNATYYNTAFTSFYLNEKNVEQIDTVSPGLGRGVADGRGGYWGILQGSTPPAFFVKADAKGQPTSLFFADNPPEFSFLPLSGQSVFYDDVRKRVYVLCADGPTNNLLIRSFDPR
ncbi:MAG: Outer membrane protein [Candidatus Ozemobacter sibiricus]|uniref:Outer membrane protein n=1 Tax=Candidatus Ozemobacter sibiricus TaxID=2268124 RepID=A0A367ZRE7_9BACT|nr:MAG: Outer membrane protein [Candidatus Ozemobacter sibiricus]